METYGDHRRSMDNNMAKVRAVIQPGPIFYAAWRGAMEAKGEPVTKWAESHGLTVTNLKFMATGASNGPKSRDIREKMMASVGEEVFRVLYEYRLQNEGLLS